MVELEQEFDLLNPILTQKTWPEGWGLALQLPERNNNSNSVSFRLL